MKLLAIDGNSIINRAFYGIKLLTAKDGTYTNAVYGFINILNRLTELEKPDGVAVAFDLKAPTFRHKKYAEYKAGRKGMPEELAQQMPIMKEWLTLAGYTCVECETYEADDILGTLAALCEKSGNECVIATGDRDSLQLVSDTTRVLLAATKMGKPEIINYDKATLFERYGLTPPEMIELKSLMGDSSDNIPGVAGVGEKTATDLITRFHSIDNIYESLETLDIKESMRKKLEAGRESAYLSRELGTICREAPINPDISHYKIKPRNDAELARLMTRLEFFKLMEKMGLKPDNSGMQLSLDMSDKKSFKFIENADIKNKADIYIADGEIIAVSGDTVTVISDGELEKLLKDGGIKKRVHDFKNLSKKYPDIAGVRFDTMLAAYLCNPSASSYATDRIIAEYAPYEPEIEGETDEFIKNACLFSLACDTLEGVSFPKPFLVRADVLAHLSAFGKGDMTVRIGSSHVLFASGNLCMLARLQGVDTYNVDAVIPEGYRESVTVKTADFVRELNYLKECSALTAKPCVRFAGEQLSIAASGGAFETGIEVRGRGDMVLGFDLYHMLDALKQFKGEAEVCIHLSSPYAPIVIDAAGRSDFALVVPVRLKEEMAA